MPVGYDDSFSPYVIPTGVSITDGLLPEPGWAAMMLTGQIQARLAGLALRLEHRVGTMPVIGAVGQLAGRSLAARVPAAEGNTPTDGDAEFVWARLAGTNPFSIERVRSLRQLPPGLRLSEASMSALTDGGPTLEARLARGELYMLRYDALAVRNPSMLQRGKFVAPASALMAYAPELQAPFPLVPLAIEVPGGRADGPTCTVTSSDGARWLAARRLVNATDVNAAELLVHLARTHYMTAPFAIALRRMVPRSHPLFKFLFPHLRHGLFVDRMAWQEGFRDTAGILIRSLGGTAAWSREVAKSLWYSSTFREQHLERDLEARGVADAPFDYPYRDDGRLLWAAIHRFAGAWVGATWADDASIVADEVLQGLVRDLTDPRGGNVRGLTAGANLDSRTELIEILTQVIFVAGPLHSLTHYGAAAQLQDVASNPSWLTANPMTGASDADPDPVLARHQVGRVISTNKRQGMLGSFAGTALGRDSANQVFIDSFQADLLEIEAEIVRRNRTRLYPFLHFLPSRITNGITT